MISVHEGQHRRGKDHGLMRTSTTVSSSLEWFLDDVFDGKLMSKWTKSSTCEKNIYKNGVKSGKFIGNDMSKPF